MSEETILKNSIFGGYKKSDVIQYIDDILEQNENKVKQLEEQIAFFIKENSKLKSQVEKTRHQSVLENKGESNLYQKNDVPIPFPKQQVNLLDHNNDVSVRTQMELPEGSYIITKDNRVTTLPEPLPIYQTKHTDYVAATSDEAVIKNQTLLSQEVTKAGNQGQETDLTDTIRNDQNQQIETLQAELSSVKKELKEERQEKQQLLTKLEYSKELITHICKSE